MTSFARVFGARWILDINMAGTDSAFHMGLHHLIKLFPNLVIVVLRMY